MEEIPLSPLDKVARAVWEVKLQLESGNDAIVPLRLLRDVYRNEQNDPMGWPQFETGAATILHDGKRLLYILLKPEKKPNSPFEEIPTGE